MQKNNILQMEVFIYLIILLITNNSGGLYNFRREVIESVIKRGDSVIISCPVDETSQKLEALGCRCIDSPISRRSKNPLSDLSLLYNYKKLIKKESPDVVLTYTIKPNIYGGIACQITHKPYLSNITGLGTSIENRGLLSKVVMFLYKIGLRRANCVFFQNSANENLFNKSGIIANTSKLIPGSGVNLDKYCLEDYPSQDSPLHLTFVGRIMRDKGINELLSAAEIVKKHHPDVIFDLIGPFDEDYKQIVQQAEDKGLINYLGRQADVRPFYKRSWAVVMPSYHEGMCNVCLEAAATGRPVIATNVPGCRETFDDDISGIGFEARSAQALADAIEKFISLSYEEKVQMGLNGRKKMEEEFDRQIVIDAYMGEIEKTQSALNKESDKK